MHECTITTPVAKYLSRTSQLTTVSTSSVFINHILQMGFKVYFICFLGGVQPPSVFQIYEEIVPKHELIYIIIPLSLFTNPANFT